MGRNLILSPDGELVGQRRDPSFLPRTIQTKTTAFIPVEYEVNLIYFPVSFVILKRGAELTDRLIDGQDWSLVEHFLYIFLIRNTLHRFDAGSQPVSRRHKND